MNKTQEKALNDSMNGLAKTALEEVFNRQAAALPAIVSISALALMLLPSEVEQLTWELYVRLTEEAIISIESLTGKKPKFSVPEAIEKIRPRQTVPI